MEYADVKRRFSRYPELTGLDDVSAALLFWRGEEVVVEEYGTLYEEGAKLDDTFCPLVSGDLTIEKAGSEVGSVLEGQIFGEMAFFADRQGRTATVRVSVPQADVLKTLLAPAALATDRLAPLKKYLGLIGRL